MSEFDIHRRENPRILLLFWVSLAAALFLVLGLVWRQLIAKEAFDQIEKRQIERRILKPGPRGNIYDREGRLLVGNRPHYSAVVYLDDLRPEFRKEYSKVIKHARKEIADTHNLSSNPPKPNYANLQWDARMNVLQRYIDQINAITGRSDKVSRTKLKRHFNEQLLLPLPLALDLAPEQYARLAEKLPPPPRSPIRIHTDTARYYPYGSLAAHALGYVQSTDPDAEEIPDDGIKTFTYKKIVGKTGIERSFNDHLTGKSGMEIWRVDPLGFQDTRLQLVPPKQGDNLITSIDIDLQRAAETALGERIGAAVAIDVQTGEVLTIASHPGYDLNRLSPYIPRNTFDEINQRGAWLDRSVQLSYPPGSTFKLITAIAGLLDGVIDANSREHCTGVHRVGNRIFRCHARNGHGVVDLSAAIEGSCNVFFYARGLQMGIDTLSEQAKRFGLDQPTGIELPFETRRLVVPTKEWKRSTIGPGWVPGDTANTSIGQGFLLVTPLQMATATASIARGETRTRPTLQALSSDTAQKIDHGGEKIGLRPEEKRILWEGMERVVGRRGTGRLVQIPDLRIAGKTGTADFRAHGEEVNLAWFIGFAPIENPKIAVAVMIQGADASQSYHGGSTAGPVAKDLFLEAIKKYPERMGFPIKSD